MKWAYISLSLAALYFLLRGNNNDALGLELSSVEEKVLSFRNIIIDEATKQAMDPAVIAAIIHWESGGNPAAYRHEYDDGNLWATSFGLMQVLDITADVLKRKHPSLKYNFIHPTLYQPEINIEIGTQYIVDQFQRYGRNLKFALASYNAGTCFMLVNGISQCKIGQSGTFCNSVGKTTVNTYVIGVYALVQRYRKIFRALYSDYDEKFNVINFQGVIC